MRTLVTTLGAALVVAVALVAPAAGSPAASTNKDIAQIAASSPQFTTLVSLLEKAGLVGALEKGTYTVFAPTNAAFAKLPKSTLAAVGKNPALLKKVLTYHVVKGKAPAAKIAEELAAYADAVDVLMLVPQIPSLDQVAQLAEHVLPAYRAEAVAAR